MSVRYKQAPRAAGKVPGAHGEVHDSLGRRLSLAAVQAAALEVSGLPAPQDTAMARLAAAIRASATELHEILGVLRGERARPRGISAADGLIGVR